MCSFFTNTPLHSRKQKHLYRVIEGPEIILCCGNQGTIHSVLCHVPNCTLQFFFSLCPNSLIKYLSVGFFLFSFVLFFLNTFSYMHKSGCMNSNALNQVVNDCFTSLGGPVQSLSERMRHGSHFCLKTIS